MTTSIQFKIHLLRLHCHLTDENDGDEIYLKHNNEKIWPLKKKYITMNGESQKIGNEILVDRGSSIDIEIWDYDVVSSNDKLGVVNLLADVQGGPYNSDMINTTSKARYVLEWEVL